MDLLKVEGVRGTGVEEEGVVSVGTSSQLSVSSAADVTEEGDQTLSEVSPFGTRIRVSPAASPLDARVVLGDVGLEDFWGGGGLAS